MNFENFKQEMTSEQTVNMNMDMNNMNMNMGGCCDAPQMGCVMAPVYECPKENVCHRYICYEVPHIMPCNTRIINHHVYRHTYRPEYTCCEENVVSNVYDQRCC